MKSLTVTAPAKLNLFLHVTGKRTDGYHFLQSLVAFTEFGDRLTLEPATLLSFQLTGPYADELEHETQNNLVIRAATELRFRGGTTEGARITLEKNIPIGAGLGGGSSDAGAAIEHLCRLWKLWGIEDIKRNIALGLGADVPMCLRPQPCMAEGIGDKLSPVGMPFGLGVVLVNPMQPLLTRDVYKAFGEKFTPRATCPAQFASPAELFAFLKTRRNDLLAPALQKVPDIAAVLSALEATYGCGFSGMSGSGATCFGLYEDVEHAAQAAQQITATFPTWWAKPTRLLDAHGQA